MKTVRIAGENYSVLQQNVPGCFMKRATVNGETEPVRVTEVLILKDKSAFAGRGYAVCSPKDDYDVQRGLEIALRNALQIIRVPDSRYEDGHRRLTKAEKAQFYQLVGIAPTT